MCADNGINVNINKNRNRRNNEDYYFYSYNEVIGGDDGDDLFQSMCFYMGKGCVSNTNNINKNTTTTR